MLSHRENVRTSKFWRKSKEKNRNFFQKFTKGIEGFDLGKKKFKIISCLCTFRPPLKIQGSGRLIDGQSSISCIFFPGRIVTTARMTRTRTFGGGDIECFDEFTYSQNCQEEGGGGLFTKVQ
jgi:hypothetical protein